MRDLAEKFVWIAAIALAAWALVGPLYVEADTSFDGGPFGSNARAHAAIQVDDVDTQIATGDAQAAFTIPARLDGWSLAEAEARVYTAGATGYTNVMVRRRDTSSADANVYSSTITTGIVEFAGAFQTTDRTFNEGDLVLIDVDAVHTTAPYGYWITLTFQP